MIKENWLNDELFCDGILFLNDWGIPPKRKNLLLFNQEEVFN